MTRIFWGRTMPTRPEAEQARSVAMLRLTRWRRLRTKQNRGHAFNFLERQEVPAPAAISSHLDYLTYFIILCVYIIDTTSLIRCSFKLNLAANISIRGVKSRGPH